MNADRAPKDNRREFLCAAAAVTGIVLLAKTPVLAGEAEAKDKEMEVSPAEDLMREHGVLNRVLLVYEEAIRRLGQSSKELPPEALKDTASLVRSFIEDYHEKLEEEHLFPRFEKKGVLVDLVKVLREQHEAGRKLTDKVLQLTSRPRWELEEHKALTDSLGRYIRMYRPHESREDTVLFPAFRDIVSPNEYAALGEDFEHKEHELFGESGFQDIVERVAKIEKQLGIYELDQFTPR